MLNMSENLITGEWHGDDMIPCDHDGRNRPNELSSCCRRGFLWLGLL